MNDFSRDQFVAVVACGAQIEVNVFGHRVKYIATFIERETRILAAGANVEWTRCFWIIAIQPGDALFIRIFPIVCLIMLGSSSKPACINAVEVYIFIGMQSNHIIDGKSSK